MNFNRKLKLTASIAASTLAISLTTPVCAQKISPAQAGETEEAGGLVEIVVTANRRAQNLQDVPIAVTAVSGADLTNSHIDGMLDLGRLSPGLQVYQVGAAILPFLRGVGSNQSNPGFENPVAIYLDGVYQAAKAGNTFDLPNIERIEVLKGPQGTLFGRNATGGAIQIVTRDPGEKTEVSGEVGYGRFNEVRDKLYAAGPITDTVGVSIAVSHRASDGYIYNSFLNKDADPSHNLVTMGKLVWKPSDSVTAKLSGLYFEYSDPTFIAPHVVQGTIPPGTSPTGAGGLFVTDYDKYTMRSRHDTVIDTHGYRGTLDVQADLGAVRLVSLTGYVTGKTFTLSNSPASESTASYSSSIQPNKEFSQEVQIQSNRSERLKWIAGGYFASIDEGPYVLLSAANLPSPVRPTDLSVPGAAGTGFHIGLKTKTYAAFAELNFEMTDRLSLTAGLRYTTENRGIDGYRFSYAALPAAGNTNQGLLNTVLGTEPLVFGESIAPSSITVKDTNFSKLTWRAALEYKINRDVMIYASNNRGFKSGTYNATSLGAEAVPVKPEVLDAYEVGFKSEFADHRIRVNASAFYYDYSNIQVGLITGAGVTSVENAAGAQIYGLDLDVAVAPTSNLSIRGAINLLDSKYTNYDRAQIFLPKTSAAACPSSVSTLTQAQADAIAAAPKIAGACSVALDARGLPLIFSPRFTANISPEYTIPVGDSRVDLSAAFYYNSGFDITPGGYFSHVGAYEDLSLSATYHAPHDRYFVRLWSDNVTNSNHAIYISPQSASFQEISARPISYGVTIGAKF